MRGTYGNTHTMKIYTIILNYNGWVDTIECLESVLRNDYPNYQVIVVDNNSPNNSMKYIKAWAEGKLDVWIKSDNTLRDLSTPPIKKTIPYIYYTREDAEKGGNPKKENELMSKWTNEKTHPQINPSTHYPLVFIQTGENLGFAGGNNVGIRYALAKDDVGYVWLLNNDTVIEKNSLSKLVEKTEFYKKQTNRVGIVGSKLLYYDNPSIIQGIGGIYNKWFGTAKHLGIFEKDKGQYDNEDVLKRINYAVGASMLVNKKFIKDIGLICEDYFLYYEEMDWAERGRRKGWILGYCWQSNVYHKEGSSIGSSSRGEEKSELADFYGLRNRIVFTKKFFPHCLWSVYLGFTVVFFNRIKRRQWKRLNLILSILKK